MNSLINEFAPRAAGPMALHCNYGPCQCVVQTNEIYCSDYCQQAAAQGIERDYCQCEHENALNKAEFSTMQALHLPGHL